MGSLRDRLEAGGYKVVSIFTRIHKHRKAKAGKHRRSVYEGEYVYVRLLLPPTKNRKTGRMWRKRREIYLGRVGAPDPDRGGESDAGELLELPHKTGVRKRVEKRRAAGVDTRDPSDDRTLSMFPEGKRERWSPKGKARISY